MLRVGAPLVAAFCGGALSGCGTAPAPTPAPAPASIEPAWDNHFEAFGEGVSSKNATTARADALTKIMLDYDEASIVSIWNAAQTDAVNCKHGDVENCKPAAEHKGMDSIRVLFDGLFNGLQGCTEEGISDGLGAKFEVVEPTTSAPGSVFLVWECKKAGYNKATDTFVFDGVKIRKQNIVIETKLNVVSQGLGHPVSFSQGPRAQDYKPDTVQKAWDNHFAAFRKGAEGNVDDPHTEALDMIMKDYIESSVVHMATYEEGATEIPDLKPHKGLKDIRDMFKGLFFGEIDNNCNLGTPLVEVTGKDGGDAKQVFLVWRIPASKFKWATDTFIFDEDFKIIKQNIVAVQAPTDTAGCATVVV